MSKFPNENTSTEIRAKSVDEAINTALSELGISKEDAVIHVLQEPSKGFLGLGAKEAVVNVEVKSGESEPESPSAAEEIHEETEDAAPSVSKAYDSDSPAENAKNFISDLLGAMGLDVSVTSKFEDGIVKLELEGSNMGIVIGKRGDTLDSLQYLTSLVVNQHSNDYIKVSIDTENYREKRAEALVALSNKLAAKVARTGKKFALEPMNPYERRIIHSNLQDNEEVTTFSVGQEPYRKVVIAPKNLKQSGGHGRGLNKGRRYPSSAPKGGYESGEDTPAASATYKADFKPQQHKAEYKNFEEYLAAHSKD